MIKIMIMPTIASSVQSHTYLLQHGEAVEFDALRQAVPTQIQAREMGFDTGGQDFQLI